MMVRLSTKPLVTIRSPLGEIDRTWLTEIEPYIYRPPRGHEAFGCWLWTGTCNKKGEPVKQQRDPITKKRSTRLVKKIVGMIYVIGWTEDSTYTFHECGTMNCLAPHHLLFTRSSPNQFKIAPYVERKIRSLRDYRLRKENQPDLDASVEGEINE